MSRVDPVVLLPPGGAASSHRRSALTGIGLAGIEEIEESSRCRRGWLLTDAWAGTTTGSCMRPEFILQKALLAISMVAAILGIGLPVFVMGLGLKLPPATGWLTVLALPFLAITGIGAAAAFLVVRLVQKEGLGTAAIAYASGIVLLVPLAAAWWLFSVGSGLSSTRVANQNNLLKYAQTQPTAFYDLLDSLAPLDQGYREQVQTLLIVHGFQRANAELVRLYFERGTPHIPAGPWVGGCLLAGMEEAAASPEAEAHVRIRAVMAEVLKAYPAAFTEPITYSGLTNTLEIHARKRAETRFAADAAMFRTNLIRILESKPSSP